MMATPPMLLRRSAIAFSRCRVITPVPQRNLSWSSITPSFFRREKKSDDATPPVEQPPLEFHGLEDVTTMEDLLPPGAKPGTVPSDYEQATGLERLEILGKMQGIDVFDMKPLDASRMGTLRDPIIVRTMGEEQIVGCTGFPADSHRVKWQTLDLERPVGRCIECGNIIKMIYIGPPVDHHHHEEGHPPPYEYPKTFADYVRPEYHGWPDWYVKEYIRGGKQFKE